MRLWSIHPKYLDRQGLLACWREGLLAQKVIMGLTKGYKNHPQLIRFKNNPYALSCYLLYIAKYAIDERGYNFDISKINVGNAEGEKLLTVTKGQLEYEFNHLQNKLLKRNYNQCYINEMNTKWRRENIISHPLFNIIEGDIEKWEKIKEKINDYNTV